MKVVSLLLCGLPTAWTVVLGRAHDEGTNHTGYHRCPHLQVVTEEVMNLVNLCSCCCNRYIGSFLTTLSVELDQEPKKQAWQGWDGTLQAGELFGCHLLYAFVRPLLST
jgi:hypothetical protein